MRIVNAKILTLKSPSGPKIGKDMQDLEIIENGAIIIENGKIKSVNSQPRLPKSVDGGQELTVNSEKDIDAERRIVMPGFVDCHTHLVFAGSREEEFEQRIEGATYMEIEKRGGGILSTVQSTRTASKKELLSLAKRRLDYALSCGTTTMEVKSGYGLRTEDEIKILEVIKELDSTHPITLIPTFLGAHQFPKEMTKDQYIDSILNEAIPQVRGLAKFCDVFCEQGVFTKEESRNILLKGKEYGLIPKIHADEIKESGASELAGEIGAISADHLNYPSEKGLQLMKENNTIAVFLPGTCLFLGHKPPVRKVIEMGIPVAIGSDFNPGSSPILSMPIIISLACVLLNMTPAEAISAATINAAHAIGLGEKIGSLETGKDADIIILDIKDYRELPYWFGHNIIKMVIKKGKIVYSL